MAKVPDLSRVVSKWQTNAGNAGPAYSEGVQNPTEDWQSQTLKAAESWKAGTAKAAADGRFAKGVQKISSDEQIQASVQKGTARYAPGIALATDAFSTGIVPVLQVIASTPLPPRGPKGDPKNINRTAVLAAAQYAAKLRR